MFQIAFGLLGLRNRRCWIRALGRFRYVQSLGRICTIFFIVSLSRTRSTMKAASVYAFISWGAKNNGNIVFLYFIQPIFALRTNFATSIPRAATSRVTLIRWPAQFVFRRVCFYFVWRTKIRLGEHGGKLQYNKFNESSYSGR